VGSRLFAGYTGPDDGSGALSRHVAVGPFVVQSKTNGLTRSDEIASVIKNVTRASVDPAVAGTEFGFVSHETLTARTVQAPTAFKLDPNGPAAQDLTGTDVELSDNKLKEVWKQVTTQAGPFDLSSRRPSRRQTGTLRPRVPSPTRSARSRSRSAPASGSRPAR